MEQNSSTENKDKMLMATVAPITRNEENESNDSRTHQKNNYKLILGSLKGLLLCSIIVVLLTALVIMVIVYPVKIERRILVLQDRIAKLEATLSEETGAEKNSSNMKSNVLQLSENVDQEISALTESLNYNISYMLHHIEELYASINAINRSTRYRYTGCYEDRRSCYLNPVKEDIYYRGCVTPSALTNVSGYYTISMRCEVNSNLSGVMESSQIMALDHNVHCECGIVSISQDQAAAHGPLHRQLTASCAIVITRCPNIFP